MSWDEGQGEIDEYDIQEAYDAYLSGEIDAETFYQLTQQGDLEEALEEQPEAEEEEEAEELLEEAEEAEEEGEEEGEEEPQEYNQYGLYDWSDYGDPEHFAASLGKYFSTAEEAENYCAGSSNPVLVWRYDEELEMYEVGTIYAEGEAAA